ncbi:MAG: dihydroorotase [Gammaproteobacteria bacterium]|nr:MAG: dihydroorotase [Gammaproteobacteria bacterium]
MSSNHLQRIHIRGGTVVDPANNIKEQRDVFVSDGKIIAVSNEAPKDFNADSVIDATGHIVCPGLVDMCARLREPGQESKATIASETAAAAAAGITSICCPPDTNPVIDTPAVATLIQDKAKDSGKAYVYTLGALTQELDGERLSEMGSLKAAGCVGVSNAYSPFKNTLILRHAMEYAASHDLVVHLHAEDTHLRNNGCVHEGQISTRLGLAGNPSAAETVAVSQILALIEQIGVKAHFCRLSTARAVQMIARAQYTGLQVTADVSAHQLHLTDMDVGYFNSNCHVSPPLRSLRDREGLRAGLNKGTISAICSDHQPHEADAKLAPFALTEPGISTLETLLPLSLRLINEGTIELSALIASLTHKPAQLLGIEAGTLTPGAQADICIYDPEREWQLDSDTLRSQGHNTPMMHWQFTGQVTHTLFRGQLIFQLDYLNEQ